MTNRSCLLKCCLRRQISLFQACWEQVGKRRISPNCPDQCGEVTGQDLVQAGAWGKGGGDELGAEEERVGYDSPPGM